MPSDTTRRLECWDAKTDPDDVSARLKKVRETMKRRFGHQQVMLVETETKAKQVLLRPTSPHFAREVYSWWQRFAGPSLAREVGVLLEKLVLRTFDRAVLERIRDEALSVPEPPGP